MAMGNAEPAQRASDSRGRLRHGLLLAAQCSAPLDFVLKRLKSFQVSIYTSASSACVHRGNRPSAMRTFGGLHCFLHRLDNHRILEREKSIERSLLQRIFAEENENPICRHHLAAGKRYLLFS